MRSLPRLLTLTALALLPLGCAGPEAAAQEPAPVSVGAAKNALNIAGDCVVTVSPPVLTVPVLVIMYDNSTGGVDLDEVRIGGRSGAFHYWFTDGDGNRHEMGTGTQPSLLEMDASANVTIDGSTVEADTPDTGRVTLLNSLSASYTGRDGDAYIFKVTLRRAGISRTFIIDAVQ